MQDSRPRSLARAAVARGDQQATLALVAQIHAAASHNWHAAVWLLERIYPAEFAKRTIPPASPDPRAAHGRGRQQVRSSRSAGRTGEAARTTQHLPLAASHPARGHHGPALASQPRLQTSKVRPAWQLGNQWSSLSVTVRLELVSL